VLFIIRSAIKVRVCFSVFDRETKFLEYRVELLSAYLRWHFLWLKWSKFCDHYHRFIV